MCSLAVKDIFLINRNSGALYPRLYTVDTLQTILSDDIVQTVEWAPGGTPNNSKTFYRNSRRILCETCYAKNDWAVYDTHTRPAIFVDQSLFKDFKRAIEVCADDAGTKWAEIGATSFLLAKLN